MVRDYELMYIVRPDLDDDGVKAAMDSVQSIVESNGGEVVKTTPWGKRRLAYEIQKLRDGHYVLLEVRLDGARVKEVERSLRIHDQVFRHMVVTYDHVPDGEEPGDAEETGAPAGGDGAAAEPSADVAVAVESGGAAAEPSGGAAVAVESGGAAEPPAATAGDEPAAVDEDLGDADAGVAADEDEEDS